MKNINNLGIPDRDKICSVNESNDGHRMEYLKNMVQNSEYICSACGRAASSEDAICAPERITERSRLDSSVKEGADNRDGFNKHDNEKACFINDYDSSLRMDMLKSLAENAEFVCSACGRAASSEYDVCSPEKL